MAQSLMAAPPTPPLPFHVIIPPLSRPPVEGVIHVHVLLDPNILLLSGGGDGWSASGSQITLQPTLQQELPVAYSFTFELDGGFSLVEGGLQISLSPGTGNRAVAVAQLPLGLLNNVPAGTGTEFLNLVVILEDSAGRLHQFDDPTIVFDPPQT